MEENRSGVEKAKDDVVHVEKKVEKVERKVEDMKNRIEDNMYEEMRAREAIKRNVVVHGVREPDN